MEGGSGWEVIIQNKTKTMNTQPTGIEAAVCADITARQKLGIAKYGRTVAESADDMLQHAYEEALDLAVYLKAEIERRKKNKGAGLDIENLMLKLIAANPQKASKPVKPAAAHVERKPAPDISDHPAPKGLLSAQDLLIDVWPDKSSRPSLRWIRKMQQRKAIPFIKMNRLVFFEPDRVRAALRRFEVSG